MYTCRVCGYDGLDFPQRDEQGYASQELCNCCGFQSGFHDDAIAHPLTIEEYRKLWLEQGARWMNKYRPKPANWDVKEQLKRIGINI